MRIAVTGATGFLGRYIVNHLAGRGHTCRCWHRPDSDRGGFESAENLVEWMPGDLTNERSMDQLVSGADAVVHAALYRPGPGWGAQESALPVFVERNVLGSIQLITAARKANVPRFVFISTCAVHDVILSDRVLDEAHPLWPASHYGAHKAAIEKFVHSFGFGENYGICSLRPTGIYGVARPVKESKWYGLVQSVKRGEPIRDESGGKEVHAADVARAVELLLKAEGIAGQAFNCYDRYIAAEDVADIAKRLTGSRSKIERLNRGPKNQIDTSRIRSLGMQFGGGRLLEETVEQLVAA